MDELIDRLGKARYISTLDLTKGCWQLPLAASSWEKTAFSTPYSLYQYRVLPFCVHESPVHIPATDEQGSDDIIIHSQGWEEHLTRLQVVLDALRQAGLTANHKK
jgi:hypothetical protein